MSEFLSNDKPEKNISPLIYSMNNGSEITKNSLCIINHIVSFIY